MAKIDSLLRFVAQKMLELIGIKKVWVNVNPNAQFVAQTLPLSLEVGDCVLIRVSNSGSTLGSPILLKVNDSFYAYNIASNLSSRHIAVTTTGIQFLDASYYVNYGGSGATANNGYVVPKDIYVLKGVISNV